MPDMRYQHSESASSAREGAVDGALQLIRQRAGAREGRLLAADLFACAQSSSGTP